MDIIRPTPEDATLCLRAMKAALGADGVIGPVEEKMVAAAQRHILGTDVDFAALSPIEPTALAARITDPGLRSQLIGAMVINSFAGGEAGPEQLAAIEGFAAALDVDLPEVKALRRYVERSLALLRFDVLRGMYIGEAMADIWKTDGLRGIVRLIGGMAGLREDPALAAKYDGLGDMPEGSLGQALHRHYRAHGFPLPGERHGGPEAIVLHDVAHILGGYSTEPEGELQVAAFTAGFRRAQSWSILIFVLCQFDLGVRIAPVAGASAEIGLLDPEPFFVALARGGRMNVDLFDDWDLWAAAPRPLDALRAEYGITPPERAA